MTVDPPGRGTIATSVGRLRAAGLGTGPAGRESGRRRRYHRRPDRGAGRPPRPGDASSTRPWPAWPGPGGRPGLGRGSAIPGCADRGAPPRPGWTRSPVLAGPVVHTSQAAPGSPGWPVPVAWAAVLDATAAGHRQLRKRYSRLAKGELDAVGAGAAPSSAATRAVDCSSAIRASQHACGTRSTPGAARGPGRAAGRPRVPGDRPLDRSAAGCRRPASPGRRPAARCWSHGHDRSACSSRLHSPP